MLKRLLVLFALLLPNLANVASADEGVDLPVNKIYQLGRQFEKLVVVDKEDDVVRSKFKTIIKEITTGELLSRWLEFIDNTPISSSFYSTVFESMTPQDKLEIVSRKVANNNTTVVKAKLEVVELYAPSVDMVTLDELFAKYKISNLTMVDVVNMLPTNSLAQLVEYRIRSQRIDTHLVKKVEGGWKIEKIDQEVVSSTMEVILPKKEPR